MDISNINPLVVSGTITAIIGMFAGYLSARRVAEFNYKNIAASKFRASFAPALAMISYEKNIDTIDMFFKDAFLIHAAAMEEFRPFIKESEAFSYQQSWDEYKKVIYEKHELSGLTVSDQFDINQTVINDELVSFIPVVKQKIENLFYFANP